MEHIAAAKERRMGWAFLPQKNESDTLIILSSPGDAVNANVTISCESLTLAFAHIALPNPTPVVLTVKKKQKGRGRFTRP